MPSDVQANDSIQIENYNMYRDTLEMSLGTFLGRCRKLRGFLNCKLLKARCVNTSYTKLLLSPSGYIVLKFPLWAFKKITPSAQRVACRHHPAAKRTSLDEEPGEEKNFFDHCQITRMLQSSVMTHFVGFPPFLSPLQAFHIPLPFGPLWVHGWAGDSCKDSEEA